MAKRPGGVLALYHHVDAAANTIRTLKEKGHRDFTVYTPVPNVEIPHCREMRNRARE